MVELILIIVYIIKMEYVHVLIQNIVYIRKLVIMFLLLKIWYKDMKTIQKMILIFIIKIVHIMKIQNWEESFLNNMIILMLKIMRIRSNLYIVEVYIEMIEDASRVINSTSSFVGRILICFYCIRRIKFHLSFIQSRCCII